ncbi:hypothetical protein M422DRAFT_252943 [Sphaerobolus stellatus SS14]|uniref:Uncharacterized protein n=1 Tax=Sphaerobolus stellatus (strain SS14) TaxID=990650 RepID=A0A0C9V9P4_SPHS4|nr:hypothetical protein M422DRAFT_252943 [Sphaerobolus stellatus SS14]
MQLPLRLQYGSNNNYTDSQWKTASDLYNNPNTEISPINYDIGHPYPQETIKQDAFVLKRFYSEFEGSLKKWKAEKDSGTILSGWKLRQLSLLPPEKQTTTGKTTKPRTCGRCLLAKDVKKMAYQMTKDEGMNGKKTLSGPGCIHAFKDGVRIATEAMKNGQELSDDLKNLLIFEEIVRIDHDQDRLIALDQGMVAYNFTEARYKNKPKF